MRFVCKYNQQNVFNHFYYPLTWKTFFLYLFSSLNLLKVGDEARMKFVFRLRSRLKIEERNPLNRKKINCQRNYDYRSENKTIIIAFLLLDIFLHFLGTQLDLIRKILFNFRPIKRKGIKNFSCRSNKQNYQFERASFFLPFASRKFSSLKVSLSVDCLCRGRGLLSRKHR